MSDDVSRTLTFRPRLISPKTRQSLYAARVKVHRSVCRASSGASNGLSCSLHWASTI